MYPKVGEKFELTLGVDQCDPIVMVKNFGYNPNNWKHKGEKIPGEQTDSFKLISIKTIIKPALKIAFPVSLKNVIKYSESGSIPQGQWLQAFRDKYPETDGQGSVGVADPSWVCPLVVAGFPYVFSVGAPDFRWAGYDLFDDWRWLVRCK